MSGVGTPKAASAAPGRRERKLRASRERLFESALALFLEQGFDATTVDQIAARADVARATAFNHYPQKVTYLEEWGSRRRATVRARLQEARQAPITATEELSAYLHQMARINEDSRAETRALMEPAVRLGDALSSPTLDVDLSAAVQRGQAAGEFRTDADADQVGTVLAASYFSSVLRWAAQEPAPFSLDDRLQQILDLVLRGLR